MIFIIKNAKAAVLSTPKSVLFAAIVLPGGILALSAYLLAKTATNTTSAKPETNDN